jgi:hypothetical protein
MTERKRLDPESKLGKLIASYCMSCWEWCCCGLPKRHDGLHECAAEDCDCTWTDEQEQQFMEEMRRGND